MQGTAPLITPREYELEDAQFEFLSKLVGQQTGIVLTDAKRELVHGRITRRIRALKLGGFADYCALLRDDPDAEIGEFINAITTNLTAFFREMHHFEFLATEALPRWLQRSADRLRVWSAGCSTGEEPYSIAMTLHEGLGRRVGDAAILATDIDTNVLDTARQGVYLAERVEGVPDRYRRYLQRGRGPNADKVRVKPEVADLIRFRQLNLMQPWPVRGPFQIVFCRNVVIYFNKDTQRQLFQRFADVIEPGGFLVIGHSETLFNICDRFDLIGRTIYRKRA
ncbi:MAG: protein-glutamate O-methyltransferase CheR [Gammaproteobacteria bacterium]